MPMISTMTGNRLPLKLAFMVMSSIFLLIDYHDSRATELKVQPTVDATEYYSDNIFLTPDGSSDSVTELAPGLSINAKGSNNEVNARYRMQNLNYGKNSSYNKTYHQLSSDLASEIINDKLYLDGFASISQRQTSVNGILDPDRIAPSDNLSNVINIGIKPRYIQRIDSKTAATIQYDISKTRYKTDNLTDNNTINQGLDARLDKFNQADAFNWNLHYRRRESDRIGNTDTGTVFEKTETQATYDATAKTTLIATAGYEKNHYQNLSADNFIEDSLWSLGMRWSLSKRTSAQLAFGHRFYGDTRSLSLKHGTRLTNLSVTYDESLTTSSLLQSEIKVFDENGNPVVSLEDPAIGAQVYLNKKLSAGFSAHTAKISLNASANHTRRIGQTIAENENIYSGTGTLTWHIGPNTSIEGSGHALYRSFSYRPETIKQADASLGVSRNMRDQIIVGVYYSFLKRVTAASPLDYTRNLIRAEVSVIF